MNSLGACRSAPAPPEPDTRHGYHLFTLQVENSRCVSADDGVHRRHDELNVGVGGALLSVPEHPYYQETSAGS